MHDHDEKFAPLPRLVPDHRDALSAGAPVCSTFGDHWIVLGVRAGPRLDTTRSVDVARIVRAALQRHSVIQPAPEVLSGHIPSGAPSERPHLAIVPLPKVGTRDATGGLCGIALILPRGGALAERQHVLRALDAWERGQRGDRASGHPWIPIWLAGGTNLWVQRERRPTSLLLRPARWCHPARIWATVTPIALDRHPGELRRANSRAAARSVAEATESIAAACRRIGLPTPHVELRAAPPVRHAPAVGRFPAYPPNAARVRRQLTHAVLEFDRPVVGPILLGAGRYYGLGLLCPS